MWKVEINDSKYSSWKYIGDTAADLPEIHPASAHLFHGDQFIIAKDTKTPILTSSPIREIPCIAGVILFSAPPCGKCTRTGKMLWRVVPHTRHYPEFIVPATQKIGFAKTRINAYILFAVREWTQTHPEGVLKETIGPVDEPVAYYTYSLHSKNLYRSFTKATAAIKCALKDTFSLNTTIDRRNDAMVSYDSPGAIVFDDAICITTPSLDSVFKISIAIANVCATIDALDPMLWNELPRIATSIYMPNAKQPMLPPALGDKLCSLHANTDRLAMILDIDIDLSLGVDNKIVAYTMTETALVRVVRNSAFGDVIPNNDIPILNIAHAIDPTIADMSGAIRFWMRLANTHFAQIFAHRQVPAIFLDELKGGYTTDFGAATYARITSPIRRAADLVNQIIITGGASPMARAFADKYLSRAHELAEMEYTAKKVQSIARIVDIQRKHAELKNTYCGISQPGGIVFFPELRVWFRDPREFVEQCIGDESQFSIALFPNEHSPYRKVRIMAIPPPI
jgi:hypothetical protein